MKKEISVFLLFILIGSIICGCSQKSVVYKYYDIQADSEDALDYFSLVIIKALLEGTYVEVFNDGSFSVFNSRLDSNDQDDDFGTLDDTDFSWEIEDDLLFGYSEGVIIIFKRADKTEEAVYRKLVLNANTESTEETPYAIDYDKLFGAKSEG